MSFDQESVERMTKAARDFADAVERAFASTRPYEHAPEICGMTRHGFVCDLPLGHNVGQADIAGQHRRINTDKAPFKPGEIGENPRREAIAAVLVEHGWALSDAAWSADGDTVALAGKCLCGWETPKEYFLWRRRQHHRWHVAGVIESLTAGPN